MRKFLQVPVFVLFCLVIQTSNAQVRVSGTLKDSLNKPVAYATVGLYKPANTNKPLQNIFSGKHGEFEFVKVLKGEYVIIATYSGYQEKETPVKVDSTNLVVDPILMKTQSGELGAVVVTAAVRKPLIEQEDDKLIFNTESDPSLEGLTAVDVMRKTPFLSVDGDGNVSMNGKTNFKVLLNGKETAMFTKNLAAALKSFPASLIKRVEVITSPSAKYDGEGVGGVINIITHKKVAGYNGNLGVSYSTLNSVNLNGSINIKYGKMGLSGYVGLSNGRAPRTFSYSETESLNPVAYYKRITDGSQQYRNRYRYGSFEWSYDMDSLNSLSVYFDLNGGNSRGNQNSGIDVIAPDRVTTTTSLFNTNSSNEYPSLSIGSDFIHKSGKTAGKETAFKVYLQDSRDYDHSEADQLLPNYHRFVVNDNRSPNKSAIFETNFVQPLKKSRKLEYGLKATLRKAESDYLSLLKYNEADDFVPDPTNTNRFDYTQEIYSAYGTYSFKWKDISFRLGSRLEHTEVDGNFETSGTTVSQSYTTYLPNIYLSRKFKKIHNLSLSYNKRLRRPYIWDLNPFVSNLDSLNIRKGNPDLGPDILHAFEFGYTVIKGKTSISTRLIENFSNRQIISYSNFNAQTGVVTGLIANAGISRVTMLGINISTKLTKDWTMGVSSNIRYTVIKNRFNKLQDNNGFGGYVNFNTSYAVTPKWRIYGSGYLSRPDVQLQGQSGSFKTYSLGTNYKFFDNKLTLGVNGNNFFTKYLAVDNRAEDVNFRRRSQSRSVIRSFTFSLNWSFGKLSENISRKQGVSNDDIKK